ncbi:MAG: peptidoglycan DD-metalloendopeptidase family protein [Coprobacter sp.]|nr:peptidoglycan DD-metalloendopeptidase family protein [Coprobacter sp.]
MNFTKLKTWLIAGLTALSPLAGAIAQTVNPGSIHSQQHQDLLANQRNIKKEISLIDSLTFQRKLQQEAEEFPAIDLYGDDWNNEWVNPYKTTQLPDSFAIDVSDYCMPVPGYKTSDYGWRWKRMHRGVDLKLQVGDSVRAAFSGKVRITKYDARGYGYYVLLRHENGLETIYGHLSKILVRPNQIVKKGEVIALGGNTGRSTGPHLHFETRFLGIDLNPNDIFDFTNQVPHTDIFVYRPNGNRHTASTSGSAAAKTASASGSHKNGTQYATHRVKSGDTLYALAAKYHTSVNQLCKLNRITQTTKLKPGQVLKVR